MLLELAVAGEVEHRRTDNRRLHLVQRRIRNDHRRDPGLPGERRFEVGLFLGQIERCKACRRSQRRDHLDRRGFERRRCCCRQRFVAHQRDSWVERNEAVDAIAAASAFDVAILPWQRRKLCWKPQPQPQACIGPNLQQAAGKHVAHACARALRRWRQQQLRQAAAKRAHPGRIERAAVELLHAGLERPVVVADRDRLLGPHLASWRTQHAHREAAHPPLVRRPLDRRVGGLDLHVFVAHHALLW